MRKEIVIGTDLHPLFNSTCMWYFGDASQNKLFYILCSDHAIVYIYKDSPEGKEMEEWLSVQENRNNDSVHKKMLEFLLPRMSPDEFAEILDMEKKSSWNDGYKQAQYDIKKALGL